jgi:hypothetical protein
MLTDYYTSDCGWPFLPTGDGWTVFERNPDPTLVKYAGMSCIKTPFWHYGYNYFYIKTETEGSKLVRKEHPYAKDLYAIYCIIERFYKEHLGIRRTKATEMLCQFIIDTQRTIHEEPSLAFLRQIFSPEALKELRQRLKRLRSPPIEPSILADLLTIQETLTQVFARSK